MPLNRAYGLSSDEADPCAAANATLLTPGFRNVAEIPPLHQTLYFAFLHSDSQSRTFKAEMS